MNTGLEFLVTAQCYEKNDKDRQTILLHETFFADDSQKAQELFHNKFDNTYKIVKIYSAIELT